MERDPQLHSFSQESNDETTFSRSRLEAGERLLSKPAESNPESKSASKSFEELVREALEEELKYERDPQLRHLAAERADEILAEFQEAKQLQAGGNPLSSGAKDSDDNDSKPSDELTPDLAKQLGIKSGEPKRPVYPGSSLNLKLADIVLGSVIVILLIIVIFLLS